MISSYKDGFSAVFALTQGENLNDYVPFKYPALALVEIIPVKSVLSKYCKWRKAMHKDAQFEEYAQIPAWQPLINRLAFERKNVSPTIVRSVLTGSLQTI